MSDFTHLHVHSHYSLLDGLAKVEPLVRQAKELGMASLAITDHGVMYGVVEFVQTAQRVGIKPIIGLEAYVAPGGHTNKRGRIDADPRHLTMLAADNLGYQNLIQLTTAAHLHGFYYKPRIDYELLQRHAAGLIVLSGCLNGDIPQAILSRKTDEVTRLIKWHLNAFGRERFYFEVQHHPNLREQKIINEALFNLSRKHKVGLVATADSHYLHADDAEAQDVLICVQTGKKVQDRDRLSMLGEDFSLKGATELKELWREHPEAIDNTQRIAEQCAVQIPFGVSHLPHYPLPDGVAADDELKKLSEEGLKQRYGQAIPAGALERLRYELEVIKKTGFASYFLIVADFVNEAKRRGILVGPGRGSAAGSLVSYLTNITNLDPLQYDLLFERFLNPQRVSMPDIDLDFADDRRDEVIAYVRAKYGKDHVAQIITFGTMAARAAVRDAGRALGFPYAFCDQIAKAIPPFMDFAAALKQSSELRGLYESDPQAQRLIDTARKLEGVCRHASTHAAGVVITEQPLTTHLPLQLSSAAAAGAQDTVTQYAMQEVEALGLLKIDFLGLKNLTIIQNALDRIEQRTGQAVDINRLPLNDPLTYQLLQTGATTGVFQLESSGMKRYLKELKPTVFEDIISILALYRPGPMDSIPDYIAGKHGQRRVTYLHPLLEPILQKTYGVIVTQDQVLEIARRFAGFSYAEADILRKAVGKKIKALLDEQREKFIEGAIQTNSVSQSTAQKVWDFIEPFARYGFNRAHAACYAMIAFQTAYLKAHYPAEFMAAMLTSDQGNIERAAIEVAEAISMGLVILPPDINESEHDFTVVPAKEGKFGIRFGLAGVKNVGDAAVGRLIEERKAGGPFKDLADLFRRIDNKSLNRKTAESLTQAGALDRLGERGYILANLDQLLDFNRQLHRTRDAGQQNLFGTAAPLAQPVPKLAAAAEAVRETKLQWEKELLGMYVSEHPLSEFWPALKTTVVPMAELTERRTGAVKVAGVVSRLTKIITKSQQPMLFVMMEDLVGAVEVLVFPSLLQTTAEHWSEGSTLVVEGKLSDKDGETKLLADKVWPLTRETVARLRAHPSPARPSLSRVVIRLPRSFTKEQLKTLQRALATMHNSAGLPVELMVTTQGSAQCIHTGYRVTRSQELQQTMARIVGVSAVTYT